jgi:hypothetical protein
MSIDEKLESFYSDMEEHNLVEDVEREVVSDSTEGIDEVHVTVNYENLEKVKSEIKTDYRELGVLSKEDMNFDKLEKGDSDKYKLVVGYAGRI